MCVSIFLFTPLLKFLRTITVVITYNFPQRYANNYQQLLTRSCVEYKGKALLYVSIRASNTSQFEEILPGSTKYLDGHFCDEIF